MVLTAGQVALLWHIDIRPFGVTLDTAYELYCDLARRYGAPERHYHNLTHAAQVRTYLPQDDAYFREAVIFAAWYHDIIYDSRARDNELRSAEYAREVLASFSCPVSIREETARLILLTRTHETTPDDQPGHELLDADLAILSEDEPAYDAYAAAIRKEYAWVSDADYREGRTRVLERFLARPRIYLGNVMYTTSEARARANLSRELAALRGGAASTVADG